MTTLDPRPRPPPWVALGVLVGGALFILGRCAAAAGGPSALDHAARASDAPRMLRHQIVAAALLLPACREDSSTPTTGAEALDLGEPCKVTDDTCADGLLCAGDNSCGVGYCVKRCEQAAECEAVDGVAAVCGPWTSDGPDVCFFPCLEGDPCPTSYAVELECRSYPQACIAKESECS